MAARNATLSEVLATIKLVPKRVEKKVNAMRDYLLRQRMVTDPLAGNGGSEAFVSRQRQSVHDLIEDLVKMRTSVLSKSLTTELTIEGVTRTVQGWIIWRREAVPLINNLHKWLAAGITSAAESARKSGAKVSGTSEDGDRDDILVNFDQIEFRKEEEKLQLILSQLDAQLSRLNATTELSVPDGPFKID